MDIIRNSVWLSQGTDLLAEGLYRVLDFDRKVDLLILFKIKSERTGKPIPFSFSMFKYYIESNSITCKDYIYPSYMLVDEGNDSNLLIVFYVQIMPDDFVMQLHRF